MLTKPKKNDYSFHVKVIFFGLPFTITQKVTVTVAESFTFINLSFLGVLSHYDFAHQIIKDKLLKN